MTLKDTCSLEGNLQQTLDSVLSSRHITSMTMVHIFKAMVFSLVMYGCESWTIKKSECWRIDDFKLWSWRSLQGPLERKEVKPVNPKGYQPWIFTGRIDAEGEAPILWPPDVKWLIGKDPDAGKHWRQEEKGTTEDERIGWHHRFSGHGFEQDPGDREGQDGLASCGPWGCKESDMTDKLNNTKKRTARWTEQGTLVHEQWYERKWYFQGIRCAQFCYTVKQKW